MNRQSHVVDAVDDFIDPIDGPPHFSIRVCKRGPNLWINQHAQVGFVQLNHVDADIHHTQQFFTDHRNQGFAKRFACRIRALGMFRLPHPLTHQIRRRQGDFDVPIRVLSQEAGFFGNDSGTLRGHRASHHLVVAE